MPLAASPGVPAEGESLAVDAHCVACLGGGTWKGFCLVCTSPRSIDTSSDDGGKECNEPDSEIYAAISVFIHGLAQTMPYSECGKSIHDSAADTVQTALNSSPTGIDIAVSECDLRREFLSRAGKQQRLQPTRTRSCAQHELVKGERRLGLGGEARDFCARRSARGGRQPTSPTAAAPSERQQPQHAHADGLGADFDELEPEPARGVISEGDFPGWAYGGSAYGVVISCL